MGVIGSIYNTVVFEPLLNGLAFFINAIPFHDMGIAIILLTIVVRFIIFPLNHSAIITQIKIRHIQPELNKIQKKFKENKEEQMKRVMGLYKDHGISPFSGFLTLIVQIPIIFALYRVFLLGGEFDPAHLYSFIATPTILNVEFLGLINLTEMSIVISLLAGVSQYIQASLAIPPGGGDNNTSAKIAKNMRYVAPGLIFVFSLGLPSAVALYWTTMNIFAIIHESVVRKKAYGTNEPNNQDTPGRISQETRD